MDIRQATADDIDEIRRVARESLAESYGHALDHALIDSVVERWYDSEDLTKDLADDDTYFVVAEDAGELTGFVQSYVVSRREVIGEIDWLHVAPDYRGRGIGAELLESLEGELLGAGVERLEGSVLVANEMGTGFYDDHGFTAAGERVINIGGKDFTERVYVKFPDPGAYDADLEERTVADRTVYVAHDETVRGADGVFNAVYMDTDREERYGWACSCGNVGVVMDTMERLECGECGNKSKATRWDAAYL
jgi:ribosomal protein S18 acetylase RimI-like enzyme/ribosomal protein S27AE